MPSAENTRFMSSSICPMIKQEVSETNTNAKSFDEHEKLENLEIILCTSDSDSNLALSAVSFDPLDITAHEGNHRVKIKCSNCSAFFDAELDLKKHFTTEHEVSTGKSLSEALLFAEHGENMLCTKILYKCSECRKQFLYTACFPQV